MERQSDRLRCNFCGEIAEKSTRECHSLTLVNAISRAEINDRMLFCPGTYLARHDITTAKGTGMNELRKNVFQTYFKSAIMLMAAFFLGSIIASGVARLVEKTKDAVADKKLAQVDTCDTFVLKNTIREGREILPEDVSIVPLQKEKVPRGTVKTYQQIEGRTAKVELRKGTLLLNEYFVAKTAAINARGYIPPGYHSVSIQIHEPVVGTKNHPTVLSGDQVDVILVQKDTETGDESKEYVLLEKVPVLDAVWEEIDETQKFLKKGCVSLLLSDLQRKNLQEEFQEGTTIIRLRICPANTNQTASVRNSLESADSSVFYQTDSQPDLISQSLSNSMPQSEISLVFLNSNVLAGMNSESAGQALRPINQNELKIPAFREIPAESYAEANMPVTHVSAINKSASTQQPVENRPERKYASFFDPSSQYGKANKWVTVPRPTVVYEARPDSQVQARGVYREGNVYYSVPPNSF